MRMMRKKLVIAAAASVVVATQAKATQDLPGLAICSTIKALPGGFRQTECDVRRPLVGDCRFSLAQDGITVAYLVEYGVVLDKRMILPIRQGAYKPFGIERGVGHQRAARMIHAATGLASRLWTDSEEPRTSYLQSDDVSCGKTRSFSIRVWFRDGKATAVSVSTLPAF